MPPTNGSRVTQRELYDALIGVETRLGGKIDSLATEIRSQNTQQGERLAGLEQCSREHTGRLEAIDGRLGTVVAMHVVIDGLKDDISDIQGGENRWKAVTGLLAVISGAISGVLARRL